MASSGSASLILQLLLILICQVSTKKSHSQVLKLVKKRVENWRNDILTGQYIDRTIDRPDDDSVTEFCVYASVK